MRTSHIRISNRASLLVNIIELDHTHLRERTLVRVKLIES